MTHPSSRVRRGFTLIELLVVIAIIALLVSILMPSLAKARMLAKKAACGVNQRNVGSQFYLYGATYNDVFVGPFAQTPISESTGLVYDRKTHVTQILDHMTPGQPYEMWNHVINFKEGAVVPYATLEEAKAAYAGYKQLAGMFFCPVAPMASIVEAASWNSPASLEVEATSYHFTSNTWIYDARKTMRPTEINGMIFPTRMDRMPRAANSVMLAESQYHLWPDFNDVANAPWVRTMTLGPDLTSRSYFHHGAKELNFLYFDGHVGASVLPPYNLSSEQAYKDYVGG